MAPHKQKGEPKGAGGLSTACQSVVDQATHLKTVQECRSAQNRLISAAMSLAARQLILYVIEALTLHSHDALYRALVSIGLADVSKLVHDAGPNNTARPPTSSTYNWREGNSDCKRKETYCCCFKMSINVTFG